MPTEYQLDLQRQMRQKVRLLRESGMSDKKIEKIIKSLDLPLGSQLDLLRITEYSED